MHNKKSKTEIHFSRGICNPFSNYFHKRDTELDMSKTLTNAYSEHYYDPADFFPISVAVIRFDLYFEDQ
jgi:hypothetical protein